MAAPPAAGSDALHLSVQDVAAPGAPPWRIALPPAGATGRDLTDAVAKASAQSVDRLRIIWRGRIVQPGDALASLGVEAGCVLHLALRPPAAAAAAAATAPAQPAAAPPAPRGGRAFGVSGAGSTAVAASASGDGRSLASARFEDDGEELALLLRLQMDELRSAALEEEAEGGAQRWQMERMMGGGGGAGAAGEDDVAEHLLGARPGHDSDLWLGLFLGWFVGLFALLCVAEPGSSRRLRVGLLCGMLLNAAGLGARRSARAGEHVAAAGGLFEDD